MANYKLGPVIGQWGGNGDALTAAPTPLLETWTSVGALRAREKSKGLIWFSTPSASGNWGAPRPEVRFREAGTGETISYTMAQADIEKTILVDVPAGKWEIEHTASQSGREGFLIEIFAAIAPLD